MSAATAAAGDSAGLRDKLLAGAAAMDAPLTAAGADKLLDYLRLLDKWNARFNLSGVSGIGEMLRRHVLDSLAAAPWVSGDIVVDAGSGAGLPGIPLAALFPEKRFVLVDSNGRKTRFLFQAALHAGLKNVGVAHCRVEDYRGSADLVVCRALGTLAACAAKTRHMLAGGAMLLALKGRYPARELASLPSACSVEFAERARVPGASNRHIIGLRHRQVSAEQLHG